MPRPSETPVDEAAASEALTRDVAVATGLDPTVVRAVHEKWHAVGCLLLDQCGQSVLPGGYVVLTAGDPPNEGSDIIVDSDIEIASTVLYANFIAESLTVHPDMVIQIIDATLDEVQKTFSDSGWIPGLGLLSPPEAPRQSPTGAVLGETVFGAPHRYWLWVTRPAYLHGADGADRADLDPGSRSVGADMWWTCAKATHAGDIAVIYESGRRQIAYVVQALSDAFPIHQDETARTGGWSYGCEYLVVARLARPIALKQMRTRPALAQCSAIRASFQQRAYVIEHDEWTDLRDLLQRVDPTVVPVLDALAALPPIARMTSEADIQRILEQSLAPFRRVNLTLTLYQDPVTGRSGAQYLCPAVGVIDLLTLDQDQNFVVIELKRGKATREDFGQLASYVGWVGSNLAPNGTATGVLVSDGETPQWQEAQKLTDRIQRADLKALQLLADDGDVNEKTAARRR